MGSCEPAFIVEDSLCGLPDETVGELQNCLGDMGSVTLDLVDEFRDCQGFDNGVIDPPSSQAAVCQLLSYNEGRPVTERLSCFEAVCPLSNTNGGITSPVDGCCAYSQNKVGANLVDSSVRLETSISMRDNSCRRSVSEPEQKLCEECEFPSSNANRDTTSPVDGCQASSQKFGANLVDPNIGLEVSIPGRDYSCNLRLDKNVSILKQKRQDECGFPLSNTNRDATIPVDWCPAAPEFGASSVDSGVGLDVSIFVREASWNLQQDHFSELEKNLQDECDFLISDINGDTISPEGVFPASKKIDANSVNSGVGLEASISRRDGSLELNQDMVVLVNDRKLQDECESSGLCSTKSDQVKQLCCLGTLGSYLEREGPHYEDEVGKSVEKEEMSMASDPLTVSQSKCSQCAEQKVPGDVNGFSVEGVGSLQEFVEEKCDVITGISVSLSTQASLKEENPANLAEESSNVASECALEQKSSQQSFQPCGLVNIASCKSVAVPDLEEGCAPSGTLTYGSMVDSTVQMYSETRDCFKPNYVSAPSEEAVTDSKEVVEQKCYSSVRTSANLSIHSLHIEENICNLMQRSLNIASEFSGEESTSLQSPLPLDLVDNDSSKRSAKPDVWESDAFNSALTCSSMVDSIDGADGEVKANAKSFVSESNCPDDVRVLPRRSTRVSKLNQMNEVKKAVSQFSKKVNTVSLPRRAIGISFKMVRRKRSYLCKHARSSTWGALGNIMEVFKQNDGILKHDSDLIQAQTRGSLKTRDRQGSKKQKSRTDGNSQEPKGKSNASIGCIRLKVKFGKQVDQKDLKVVLPEGNGSSAYVETMKNERLSESDCRTSMEIAQVANDLEMEHKLGEDVQPPNGTLENLGTPVDVSVLDAHPTKKDLASIVTQSKSFRNSSGDCHGVPSQIGTESLGEATANKNLGPGMSPHSEVINVIQDAQVGAGMQRDIQVASFDSAQSGVPPQNVMCSNMLLMKAKKGKRNGKVEGSRNPVGGCCGLDEIVCGPTNLNKTIKLSKRQSQKKVGDGLNVFNPSKPILSATSQIASSSNLSNEGFVRESFPSSGLVELGVSHEALKAETGIQACELPSHDVMNKPETWTSEFSASKTKGHKLSKTSKSTARVGKNHSRVSDSARRGRKNVCEKEEDREKSSRKSKAKKEGFSNVEVSQHENHPEIGGNINVSSVMEKDSVTGGPAELIEFNLVANAISRNPVRNNADNEVPPENISSLNAVFNGFEEQFLPARIAWVCCDDCRKWRCISAGLADYIEETNCKWICKDNADKAFSDCSIPQEKSNAEINAELEISDASCEEDAYDRRRNYKAFEHKQPRAPQEATWKLIKSNLFLHRSRKTQTIDEIMVCHCKRPPDGSLGCGDECLNRMLNIECDKGTCPCGDLCSNQQFQKYKYAKFKWFRCGKKGHGLQLLEDVYEGQFLIEYIGEVLDSHAYEARQRAYASKGQKHFYFMTLNGSEIIDACAKGNLGRFINHSCEPNCRTEKWMVNGEICIGLFAIRNIKKGEEVTFDYNYVRVYGAAAKKCVCGSSVCRGYIGGDPLNAETVVQGDSDEEFPEPVMIDQDGSNEDNMDEIISATSSIDGAATQFAKVPLQAGDTISKSELATVESISSEKEDTLGASLPSAQPSPSEFSLRMEGGLTKSSSSVPSEVSVHRDNGMRTSSTIQLFEVSLHKEDTSNISSCKVQTLDSSSSTANTLKKCMANTVCISKSRSDKVEDKPNISKSFSRVKASQSASSIKKGKSTACPVITNKTQVMAKPKKQMDCAIRSRFEGVEEKLNEFLDDEGGISKRKDASKGYLKLLVLTAASGDNGNGEAFQSARDLSIILDVLMKTKSRTVLTDIINKNGLQMLHNILKQNSSDFNKIPILRKLLKRMIFKSRDHGRCPKWILNP
ncbi:histone-lysine N-methyltransferase ASHH2-like isoform X2 [Macadamia integrifolia]|uniref:histone-lysine N-methyltransferase ASHH2-like isoform X2 n=1 Tax=Macadamia integrifolia TaxID=60698 RepID=UPI001C530E81|nr:histone-lysine N-methyltransferase ASHH2-like isoform X2 [Macadamia integrifolia]